MPRPYEIPVRPERRFPADCLPSQAWPYDLSRDYPHGLADEDVLAIARDEKRILLADRDFGELIFHQGLVHVGVIFFRLPGADLQTKIENLDTVLEERADELARGEFLVVTPGQIRIAGRPRS